MNKKVSDIAGDSTEKHGGQNVLCEKGGHRLIKDGSSPAVEDSKEKHVGQDVLYEKGGLLLIKDGSSPAVEDSTKKHGGQNVLCEKGGHRLIKDGSSLKVEKTIKMSFLYYVRVLLFSAFVVCWGLLGLTFIGFYAKGALRGEFDFSEAVPAITFCLAGVFMLLVWPHMMLHYFSKARVLNMHKKNIELSWLLFGRQILKKKIASPHAILVKPTKNWDPKAPITWGCRIWLIKNRRKLFVLGTSYDWVFPIGAMRAGEEFGGHIANLMDIPLRLEGWERLDRQCKDRADGRTGKTRTTVFSPLEPPIVTSSYGRVESREHSEDADGLDIPMVDCPYCDTHVLLMSDGRCPNCKKMITEGS